MKKLRIVTLILSAVILVASVITYIASIGTKDAPKITCSVDGKIYASVFVTDEELLQYVTATDKQDGDISDSIKVMRKKFFADVETKTASITYAVCDSDNNVSTLQRLLVFTDYESPKFTLETDFIFPAGYSYNFRKYVNVIDMIDGGETEEENLMLNEQIKVISSSITSANTYPVNIKFSNSVGDTAELNIDAIITTEDYFNTKVRLKEFLKYVPKGAEIDYKDNMKDIFYNGTPLKYTLDDVQIDASEVNTAEAGTYYAYYRLYDDKGKLLTLTRMIIVVEEV